MSTTKVAVGIAGVVALLAVGSALYQNNAAHESAAALAAANAERTKLQSQLTASEKRARDNDDMLAAVRKDLSDLRAQPPAPAPAKASTLNVGPAMEYILEHPELQATLVRQQILRAKIRYERFVKEAGLSAPQQEQFFKALEDGFVGELDLLGALYEKGYGVGNPPTDPREKAQLAQLSRESKEKWQAGLHAALGDEGMRKFDQYSSLLPERNVAEAVASQVCFTDSPLTVSQAEQLAQILKENRFKPGEPSPYNTMGENYVLTPRALSGRLGQAMQSGGMTKFDWQNPVTDAALVRAQAILTPTQFAALQRLQAQQITQFQLAPPPPAPAAK